MPRARDVSSGWGQAGAVLPAILNFGTSVSAMTTRLPATKSVVRRVEAIAGEPAQAVAYLRVAFPRGVPYSALHENTACVDFEPIWDSGPLQQLLQDRSCDFG